MIRPLTGLIILGFDILAMVLGWALFVTVTNQSFPIHDSQASLLLKCYGALCLITLFLCYNRGHYRIRMPWWSQVQHLANICAGMIILHGFVLYLFTQNFGLSFIMVWPILFFSLLIARQLARSLCICLKTWPTPTVLLGDSQNLADILLTVASDKFPGFEIHTVLLKDDEKTNVDKTLLPTMFKDVHIIEVNGDYLDYIQQHPEQFYIVSLDPFRGIERDRLTQLLQETRAEFAIVPPVKRESLFSMESHTFFGFDTALLRPRDVIHSPLGKILKRGMDVVGASIGLLLLLPVFAIVAILIKRTKSAVYFGHTRIGRNEKPFKCWKFSSMYPDAKERLDKLLKEDATAKLEWQKTHKLKDDPRVTPIGHFIRKTSIDELPQLWNVLRGDMSLVGPRPITESEKKYYGNHWRYYAAVRPGITGLWQASGRSDVSYGQRVLLDSWYVRNWSLWHDIVIVIKTFRTLVARSGAY